MEAELPDGTILDFPDDATPDQIKLGVKNYVTKYHKSSDPGFFSSILEGFGEGVHEDIRKAAQTYQALKGETPSPTEPPKPTNPNLEPLDFSPGLPNPTKIATHFARGIGSSLPELVGGAAGAIGGSALGTVVGGPPGAVVGGITGAGAGAGIVNVAKNLAPDYADALKTGDPDPFSTAIKNASLRGAITGASFAAFELAPFRSAVQGLLSKAFRTEVGPTAANVATQAGVIQPAIAAAGQGAQNLSEGKPFTEGLGQAAAEGSLFTAIPMGAHLLARGLLRHLADTTPPPATEPTLTHDEAQEVLTAHGFTPPTDASLAVAQATRLTKSLQDNIDRQYRQRAEEPPTLTDAERFDIASRSGSSKPSRVNPSLELTDADQARFGRLVDKEAAGKDLNASERLKLNEYRYKTGEARTRSLQEPPDSLTSPQLTDLRSPDARREALVTQQEAIPPQVSETPFQQVKVGRPPLALPPPELRDTALGRLRTNEIDHALRTNAHLPGMDEVTRALHADQTTPEGRATLEAARLRGIDILAQNERSGVVKGDIPRDVRKAFPYVDTLNPLDVAQRKGEPVLTTEENRARLDQAREKAYQDTSDHLDANFKGNEVVPRAVLLSSSGLKDAGELARLRQRLIDSGKVYANKAGVLRMIKPQANAPEATRRDSRGRPLARVSHPTEAQTAALEQAILTKATQGGAPNLKTPPLVVARRMPSGDVRYGKKGWTHADLLDNANEDINQNVRNNLGFAEPGGPFMSREEALNHLQKNDPASFRNLPPRKSLEALEYDSAKYGNRRNLRPPFPSEDVTDRLQRAVQEAVRRGGQPLQGNHPYKVQLASQVKSLYQTGRLFDESLKDPAKTPKRISGVSKWFYDVYHNAQRNPYVAQVWSRYLQAKHIMIEELTRRDSKLATGAEKLPLKGRAQVGRALSYALNEKREPKPDASGQLRLTDAQGPFVLNKDESAVFMNFRRMADSWLTDHQRTAVRNLAKGKDYDLPKNPTLADIQRAPSSVRDDLLNAWNHFESLRNTGYSPRVRFGDQWVVVRPRGQPQAEPTYIGAIKSSPSWMPGSGARTAKAKAALLAKVETQFPRATHDYSDWFEPTYQNQMKLMGKSLGEAEALLKNYMGNDAGVAAKMMDAIHTLQAQRGMRVHYKQAKDIPGYSEDWFKVYGEHSPRHASFIANMEHQGALQDFYAKVGNDSKFDNSTRDYINKIVDYANQYKSEYQVLRELGGLWDLGWSVATAALNAPQPFIASLPVMGEIAGLPKAAKVLAGAYRDIGRALRPAPALSSQALARVDYTHKVFSPTEQAALKRLEAEGHLISMQALEQTGVGQYSPQMGSNSFVKGYRHFRDSAYAMFTAVENINRAVVALAGVRLGADPLVAAKADAHFGANSPHYQEARRQGDHSYALGRFLNEETNFIQRRDNNPMSFHGLGSVAFQFQKYPLQMMQLYGRVLGRGSEGKKALAQMGAAILLTSGVWGLPYADDIKKGLETAYQATGMTLDVDKELREMYARVDSDPHHANMLFKGPLGEATGAELTRRIGFGHIVPYQVLWGAPGAEFGPFWSSLAQGGTGAFERSNSGQGAAWVASELMPVAAKNAMQAQLGATSGPLTRKGEFPLGQSRLTTGEEITKAIGFQPKRLSEATEFAQHERTQQEHMKEAQTRFNENMEHNLARLIISGQRGSDKEREAALKDLQSEIKVFQRWNQKAKGPEEMLHYDPSSVEKQASLAALGFMHPARLEKAPEMQKAAILRLRKLYGVS